MALELLRQPEFLLLSEDTPLIDRYGTMLPFPLRLGVRPNNRPEFRHSTCGQCSGRSLAPRP